MNELFLALAIGTAFPLIMKTLLDYESDEVPVIRHIYQKDSKESKDAGWKWVPTGQKPHEDDIDWIMGSNQKGGNHEKTSGRANSGLHLSSHGNQKRMG